MLKMEGVDDEESDKIVMRLTRTMMRGVKLIGLAYM